MHRRNRPGFFSSHRLFISSLFLWMAIGAGIGYCYYRFPYLLADLVDAEMLWIAFFGLCGLGIFVVCLAISSMLNASLKDTKRTNEAIERLNR